MLERVLEKVSKIIILERMLKKVSNRVLKRLSERVLKRMVDKMEKNELQFENS